MHCVIPRTHRTAYVDRRTVDIRRGRRRRAHSSVRYPYRSIHSFLSELLGMFFSPLAYFLLILFFYVAHTLLSLSFFLLALSISLSHSQVSPDPSSSFPGASGTVYVNFTLGDTTSGTTGNSKPPKKQAGSEWSAWMSVFMCIFARFLCDL